MKPAQELENRIAELVGWRGAKVTQLAKLVANAAPAAVLEWKWGTAAWSQSGLVCAVCAFKDNVGLNFFQGAALPDLDKLFNAGLEAKATRSMRFYETDEINETAVTEMIKRAVAYNLSR